MYTLTKQCATQVSGGEDQKTNSEVFWQNFSASAGTAAGYTSGTVFGIGLIVITPVYYIAATTCSITASAIYMTGQGIYRGTAAVGNGLAWTGGKIADGTSYVYHGVVG